MKAVAEQKVLNTAQNMMHKLFTDELGTQYCLKGKNPDKKQFDIDPIYHLVIGESDFFFLNIIFFISILCRVGQDKPF